MALAVAQRRIARLAPLSNLIIFILDISTWLCLRLRDPICLYTDPLKYILTHSANIEVPLFTIVAIPIMYLIDRLTQGSFQDMHQLHLKLATI